jgi:hypothetical protein
MIVSSVIGSASPQRRFLNDFIVNINTKSTSYISHAKHLVKADANPAAASTAQRVSYFNTLRLPPRKTRLSWPAKRFRISAMFFHRHLHIGFVCHT